MGNAQRDVPGVQVLTLDERMKRITAGCCGDGRLCEYHRGFADGVSVEQDRLLAKPPSLTLELRDHGATCPNRGIPLIDVYLSAKSLGVDQGCWMHGSDLSVPFAESIAAWFAERGAKIKRQEASSDVEHSRDLFTGVE